MRHRRRFLNVVTRNWVTGAHSLHRIDLHSSHNNLFYPTTAAAEEAAAAAQDPSALFRGGTTRRHVALNEVPQIRMSAAAQSFLQRQLPSSRTRYDPAPVWCVAVSESETVFLDGNSSGTFLYDADERCVVTLPDLHESKRFPVCVSVSSAGNFGTRDDTIYVMDRSHRRRLPETPPSSIQLQALVHRKMHTYGCYLDNWRCDELPPPPYVAANGGDYFILSHALVGGGASDVICVSTSDAGTYCFDTATRSWSKAGDWALSFEGKIEHDVDLGVWVGFLHYRRKDEVQRLCATADLFAAADRRRVTTLCHDAARWLWADDGKDLEPPYGWYQGHGLPKLVSLGSGKFCLVQFFETREKVCSDYGQYEEVVDKFAVFTGVEVVRCGGGGDGKDGDDEQVGNGSADGDGAGDLRVIVHKSKRYMLTDSEATIAFVL